VDEISRDDASAEASELSWTAKISETKQAGVLVAKTSIANSSLQGVPEEDQVCLENQSIMDTTRTVCVDGRITLLDHVATVLFGGKAREPIACSSPVLDEATGLAHLVYADPEGWMKIESFLKTDGQAKDFEVGFRQLDEDEIWVSVSSKPVRERSGKILYQEEVICSTTEEKRSEMMRTKSLQERDLMLNEIHHRVNNNLQIISSLLSIQSRHIKDQASIDAFKEMQDRIRSIALAQENLYGSEDLSWVDMSDYIRSLAAYLVRSYKIRSRVKLNLKMDQVFLGIDKAVPCGLIINELITNSLKHAFPEGKEGEIRVDLMSKEDGVEIIISDNGVGLPEGFDLRWTSTLGMALVRSLIGQLKGSVDVCIDRGTRYGMFFASR
jgi:two-component sensor histidine kinase